MSAPLGPKVTPAKSTQPAGAWTRIGSRDGYHVWRHSDGRIATTPPGQVPDDKLNVGKAAA
jgi:hypothetical protein